MDTCIPEGANCEEGSNRACACRDPRDGIDNNSSEYECYRKNYNCSALALCDEGYECDQHNHCICKDLLLCGIDCSGDCTCPYETVCDPVSQTCRLPLICLDNEMCPDPLVCRPTMGVVNHYTCQLPDGQEVGGSCQGGWDCNSAICYTNVCLQLCTKNADCPAGQYCVEIDHGEPGCVVESLCEDGCSDAAELCADFGHECLDTYCRVGADCETDCGITVDRPLLGKCLPSDFPEYITCGDDEFVIEPTFNEGYCFVYQACWTDADCPDPYGCIQYPEFDAPPPVGSGLCGRLR